MDFLDLFAGIGGFRMGLEHLGYHCIGFCEIDKFARASYSHLVLKQYSKHCFTDSNFLNNSVT